MSEVKVYPKGVSFFAAKSGSPKWVLGTIIITPIDFLNWIKKNESLLVESEKYGKQLRLKVTDKGISVDTWNFGTTGANDFESKEQEQKSKQFEDVVDTDLPF